MTDTLKKVRRTRYAPAAAYLLAVAIAAISMYARTLPPPPLAAHDLVRNQKIVPGDLETSNIKPLLGQFVKKDVRQGTEITGAMLATKPWPAPISSTMAALVTVTKKSATTQKIAVGQDVQVCLKNDAFGDPGKVLTLDCDEGVCMVLVQISTIPAQKFDPNTARLANDPQGCAKRTQ